MKSFTKEELIHLLQNIAQRGWIENYRGKNNGAVGNIIEDLLGIEENNLPIPNAAEWELKAQRSQSNSLLTLFHCEPSPTALRIVPNLLLPNYGWPHKLAAIKYPNEEMSFRATINTKTANERGFYVVANDSERRIEIHFSEKAVDDKHLQWLKSIKRRADYNADLNPIPYWGYDDLCYKAGTKLKNCFFIEAETKKEKVNNHFVEFFKYSYILKLSGFSSQAFIDGIKQGLVYIDFDARTGHNHGTKFRVNSNYIPSFYSDKEVIIDCRKENE